MTGDEHATPTIRVAADDDGTDRLSRLVSAVEGGANISITREGALVARLVPVSAASRTPRVAVGESLRRLRRLARLDDLDWRKLRDEGRR